MMLASDSPYNWLNSDTRDLWNKNCTSTTIDDKSLGMVKTVYDPSPAGFCVPNSYTFDSFTKDNGGTFANGYTWNGSFFAASGYRNYGTGALGVVGTDGDYWVACPLLASNDHSGFRLGFLNGAVFSRASYNRAFGFPVRAVVEEKKEWLQIAENKLLTKLKRKYIEVT